MTAAELMQMAATLGIALEARGDRLHVEARPNVITPELKDALVRLKPELLARLAPVTRFVTLRPDARTGFAPTVPVEALELALDLEQRGFALSLDASEQFQIEPTAASGALTDQDRASIGRWRLHLGAIGGYQTPEIT